MAQGVGFSIDASFLNKIEQADKALKKLADTNDTVVKNISNTWKQIGEQGLDSYLRSLEKQKNVLADIASIKFDDSAPYYLKKFGENARSSVAEIDKLIQTLTTLQKANPKQQAIEKARQEAYDIIARADAKTGGKDWSLTGEVALREYQAQLEAMRRYVAERKAMYAQMFDEIDAKERKQQTDYSNYRQQQLNDELTQYRKNKEAQAAIDKRNHDRRQRELEEIFRLQAQHEERLRKRQQSIYNATGDSSQGALNYADRLFRGAKPMTLNNMQTALSKLQDAQRKLNLDTDAGKNKYEQLAAMIRRVQQRINEATGASNQLRNSHNSLINTGDQLMRKFALIFSVSQIQGYINKLVQVRGEFELQQRALQSILQNKAEANKIWQQTVDLAVRSPFRVGELVKYTKQLAAYRIETDKLHDTTKRLADVSAGLGVDMSRLILAFGQVRAAEYLRGTELRQFTEAGIPMLEELARYFTELEGRAVSTADVFGMISKRMVAFEDVEAVFKRMTDAGGTFYNMQEIQAETLKGQISNLHDSIDLMMNDIGSYYDRIFKLGLWFAKTFVDNWEFFSFAIKGVVVALAGYKMASLAASKSTQELAVKLNIAGATMDKNLTRAQLMQLGLKKLGGVLKGVGTAFKMAFPLAIFMAIVDVIYEISNHMANLDAAEKEINKKHNEELDRIEDISDAYNKLIAQEKKYGKASDDTLEKKRQQIIQLSEKLGENVAQIELQIKPLTSEQLDQLFKNKQELAIQASDFSAAFSKAFVENFDTWQLWGVLGENLKEDAEDYNEAVSDMTAGLKYQLEEGFKEASRYYILLSKDAQGYIDEIKKGKNINETEAQWFARKAKLMSKISSAYSEARLGSLRYSEAITEAYNVSKDFEEVEKELKKEVDDVARTLLKSFGKENFKDLTEDQKIAFVAKMNESEQLAELGLASDFIRSYLAEQYFGITINLNPTDDVVLQKWQESFNKKFGDNPLTVIIDESYYGFQKITDRATTQAKVIEQLQSRWKSLNDEIKAVEKAGAKGLAEGGSYEGYNLEASKQNLKQLQEMLDWFGADYEKKKGKGKQRDIWGERARAIQDLRKNYEDLIKTFTKYDTIARVTVGKQELINELFKDLGYEISDINFDSLPQLVDFISQLQDGLTRGSKDWLKLEDIKAAFQLDIDVKTTQQGRDEFMRGIEDMFGNYEMSLELEKLNIPPDFAKQLFGVESVDLSEIRRELEQQLATLRLEGADEGADEEVKKIKEKLTKVEELERKAQEERLKKYVKYLQKAQDARVKIKLEELRQIDEVEKESRFTKDQKKEIKEALQKESKQAIDKQTWEDFTGSAFYIEIFRDLENTSTEAIKVMRERLLALKDSLGDQSPEQLKAMVEQLEKMDDELTKRQNPFKQLSGNLKEYFEYLKKSKQLNEDFIDSQDKIRRLELNRDSLSNEVAVAEQRWKAEVKISGANSDQSRFLQQEYITQKNLLNQTLQRLVAEGKISEELARQIREGQTAGNKAGQNIQTIGSYFNEFGSGVTEIAGNLENVFGSMSDSMRDTVESIAEIANGVGNTVSGIGRVVANPADIGGYIQALGGLTSAIGAIFNTRDKSLERQIQNNIKMVEQLERAYQRLEKRIEDAYSVGTIQTNYELAKKNLIQQQEAYANMIEMEEAKKKTDKDKIREWKNELEDLTQQRQELEEQRLADLGGFGSQANYKSAAEEFANAWFDAYQEVGDGMGALEDTFDDFINNVVKKQLLIKGSNKLLQPVLDMIDKAVSDGEVTTQEMAEVNRKWNEDTKDALNSYYKSIYDMYDGLINGAGELSDLQRGIQNITEPQAAAIEAYLNSLRFFVSDSNRVLKEIQQQMSVGVNNPMVSELKAQTQLIRTIDENLSSVIGRGSSSHTGAYIKVLAK